MRAYRGIVKDGKVVIAAEADLPEGAEVTVTISEGAYMRSKLRASLRVKGRKRFCLPVGHGALPALTQHGK